MKRLVLTLTAASLFLVPLSSSVGQEGGEEKAPGNVGPEGSGITAVVTQVEGEKTEITDIVLKEEQLGLLSLTKVPTTVYRMLRGKAKISVPIRKIRKLEFVGNQVRLSGLGGEIIEGGVDVEARHTMTGMYAFGEFEVELRHVRLIEFVHPDAKMKRCDSCNRLYINPEWKFCPIEGARLREIE